MKMMKLILPVAAGLFSCLFTLAQPSQPGQPAQKGNDVTAPLHALKVDYPVPYDPPTAANIKAVLDRVFNYLDTTTPSPIHQPHNWAARYQFSHRR